MKICPKCTRDNMPENHYCYHCGTDVKALKEPYCVNCDTSMQNYYKYCPKCGNEVPVGSK